MIRNFLFFANRIGLLFAMSAGLSACYTPYNLPIAIPTSKVASIVKVDQDEGMVTMGSPYLYLEKPNVDWGKARVDAAAHCAKWDGYSQAEPVGPTRRECTTEMGGDCVRYSMVGDYKCLP